MSLAGIEIKARQEPDVIAVVDEVEALTWRELADQVDHVAAQLLAIAGRPDERVAVLGENAVPTLVAHAAGILAGVGTVALSRQLTGAEIAEQLDDSGAVAVVTGPLGLAAVTEAAKRVDVRAVVVHGVADLSPGTTPWTRWTQGKLTLQRDLHRPARSPLVYTSGTTGRARATQLRWAATTATTTVADYLAAITAGRTFPDGPHLVVSPLQHNAALTSLRHLLAGQPVVVLGRFDAETVLRLIDHHRATSTVMVPTHFQRLLALPASVRERYDVSCLAKVVHTGAACPPDVKRAMIDWFGPVLEESYGGSEIGTVARITSQEWLDHPGSVGRVVAPFEAVVLDENGDPLPAGTVGLLGFRTPPGRTVEYHADPERTRSAYIAPGVFSLGDVGYTDADGFIYITDRMADMVVSGGVNLYPAESERVLAAHPAVAEVAVIGVPDPDLGESLRALVVPVGEPPDPGELDRFSRASLASYKCPKSYEFVDSLPRNAMGKLDKRALRRPYWQSERTIAG